MPESELFKVAVQGGSFAVLVLLVVWSLWKGIPNALALHKETVTAIVAEERAERASILERHDKEMEKRDKALAEQTTVMRDVATGLRDVVGRLERLEENHRVAEEKS